MYNLKIQGLTLLLSSLFSTFLPGQAQAGLVIEVSNIRSAEGNILVAVFDSRETFLGDKTVKGLIVPVKQKGEMSITVPDLPYGTYAISIFHDVNSNNRLDTNFLGIPKERYGFSNNARGTFGPPSFEKASFKFSSPDKVVDIKLN